MQELYKYNLNLQKDSFAKEGDYTVSPINCTFYDRTGGVEVVVWKFTLYILKHLSIGVFLGAIGAVVAFKIGKNVASSKGEV